MHVRTDMFSQTKKHMCEMTSTDTDKRDTLASHSALEDGKLSTVAPRHRSKNTTVAQIDSRE